MPGLLAKTTAYLYQKEKKRYNGFYFLLAYDHQDQARKFNPRNAR
jgi:hypothetical protein